jgi:hypothetical protein
MKKLLFTIAVFGSGFMAQSQVICAVQAPAGIAGNYEFTWADPAGGDWGTPDFLIPGTFVVDTLMMVNDGATGLNAQGNPISAEGCGALLNDLTGKIAVIYRNTCEFGLKAKNAQDAGAVGVIIVNREPGVIAMGGGADGVNVTIPVAFVSDATGALMITQMANGPVVVFLGNKTGLYNNDGGLTKGTSLISKSSGVVAQLAANGSEFNFAVGTRVFNYGIDDQPNATVTATVTDPTGATVYSNTVGPIAIVSGDSAEFFPGGANSFPDFSMLTYTPGRYTLTYSLDLGIGDDYDADNTVSSDFVVNDTIFTYAMIDTVTGLPMTDNGYRPSTNNATFSTCMVIKDPNASRIGVSGIYFSASTATASGVELTGEEMTLNLYKWEDVFTDLNDAALGFTALNAVTFGYYFYPSDLQGETVYGEFNTQVILEDNQRYLACVQTVNLNVYLGHDTKTNYLMNEEYYLQPMTPNESDGTYFAVGFGSDAISSMGLRVFSADELTLDEVAKIEGMAYPNPATEVVTVSMDAEGSAKLKVTDVTGKIALESAVSLVNGKTEVNIAALESGVYIFNVTLENGQTSQFNVVKK